MSTDGTLADKKTLQPDPTVPKISHPIERIRKQDEEEQWISGEELCTEGSSDDEEQPSSKPESMPTLSSHSKKLHRPRKTHRRFHHTTPSRPKPRPSPLLHDPTPRLLMASVSGGSQLTDPYAAGESIAWRPKRGSIKLPGFSSSNVALEPLSNT